MQKIKLLSALILCLLLCCGACVNAQNSNLKLVFIRHGEKPDDGDNLNCQGLNRSLLLPALLFKKIGKPGHIYIPSVKPGKTTRHSRMFQTISPFAVKYNLPLNSNYDEDDYKGIGKALYNESGTILIVWEHQNIPEIVAYLGIKTKSLDWPANDFDSIWIVTFVNGKAILSRDKEGLNPQKGCPF